MKQIEKLMDYRESVRVVDATLRDGGLVNDFFFTDEFVKALYATNIKAGVDYMEFGYRASREMFDVNEFGKWKFSTDDDIYSIVGDNDTDLKIAIMADVGRCDYKEDIHNASESPVDLVRVATYLHQIPSAIQMIEDAKNKGYEVSCNIMAISTAQEIDIKAALEMICKSPVDVLYIVDSYGSIYPEALARLVTVYSEAADKYGKKLGIHAHNNQALAFANTIEAVGDGVDYLDATYFGMGRGAGNCQIEPLLGLLRNPKYSVYPTLKFNQDFMVPLKDSGVVWGYDLQYLVTGLLNQHPRTAIEFTKNKRTDYAKYYTDMLGMD